MEGSVPIEGDPKMAIKPIGKPSFLGFETIFKVLERIPTDSVSRKPLGNSEDCRKTYPTCLEVD